MNLAFNTRSRRQLNFIEYFVLVLACKRSKVWRQTSNFDFLRYIQKQNEFINYSSANFNYICYKGKLVKTNSKMQTIQMSKDKYQIPMTSQSKVKSKLRSITVSLFRSDSLFRLSSVWQLLPSWGWPSLIILILLKFFSIIYLGNYSDVVAPSKGFINYISS